MIGKNKTTGIDYINYRQNSFRKKLIGFERTVIIGITVTELMFFAFLIMTRYYDIPYGLHLIHLLLALGACLVSERIITCVNRKDEISGHIKNRVCCYSILAIFVALGLLHYNFCILWITPTIIMVLSTVFGDHTTTIGLFVTSLFAQMAFLIAAGIHNHGVADYYLISFVVALLIIIGTFVMTIMLFEFNKEQVNDIVSRYDGEKKLKEKLETEYLTGLLSRSAIHNELKIAVHEAYFYHNQMVCVAMIDLDHFKQVNDTYGHDKGDVVLKRLSSVIKEYLDEHISAGRVGGEEFLVLLKGYSRDECKNLMNGMLRNFRSQKFDFLPEGEHFTFSCGMCWMDNYETDAAMLVKCADLALYESKEHGRNKVTEFEHTMLEP